MDRNGDQQQDPNGGDERRGDAMPQDGIGRDAAHGDRQDDRYQGGSTGRSTGGRAGDDLLNLDASTGGRASGGRDADDATASQRERGTERHGLEGKGFDAGGGYGGAGNAALYASESGFGGQAGGRESTLGGAYAGDGFGRQGESDASSDAGSDADDGDRTQRGAGGASDLADDGASRGSRDRSSDRSAARRDGVDLDDGLSGASRRDPIR